MSEPGIVENVALSKAITPDEVVSILNGSTSIKLSGFGGQPLDCPFWLPNLETYAPELAQQAIQKTTQISQRLLLVGTAFTAIFLGVFIFWMGSVYNSNSSSSLQLTSTWSPKGVTHEGVVLMIGSSQTTVPVGAMLPNGETLRSINAARQTYTTDNNETAVKR